MGKDKRESRTWHRDSADDERHWLGEGLAGQESLLSEITPFLYAADATIFRHASQIAHHYHGPEERPLATVISPSGSIPWHVGQLSKHFDVCLLLEQYDPMIDGLTSSFGISVYEGHVPESLHSAVDFLVFTEIFWRDPTAFSLALRLALQLLSPSGRAIVMLPELGSPEDVAIQFASGELIARDAILQMYELSVFESALVTPIALQGLLDDPKLGINEFAKRHKEFFGRSARDLCLSRLYEQDFRDEIVDSDGHPRSLLFLLLGGASEVA